MTRHTLDSDSEADVAALAAAIFEAERPDKHWPTWQEYLAAFAHPPTQEDVWIRKAVRLLDALPASPTLEQARRLYAAGGRE